jgi:hypothetical protein
MCDALSESSASAPESREWSAWQQRNHLQRGASAHASAAVLFRRSADFPPRELLLSFATSIDPPQRMAAHRRSVQALGADVRAGYFGSAQQLRIDYELDSGIGHGCSAVDLDALAFQVARSGQSTK